MSAIWCFNCCHPFENEPVYLPTKKLSNGDWNVTDNFCSWECAKTYNRDYKHDMDKQSRYGLLYSMYTALTGKTDKISFAPPRECLSVFGGTMSIEEFRSSFRKRNCIKTNKPVVISDPIIEVNNFHWTSTEDARNNFDKFQPKEVKDEQLKLSRKSSKKTNQNTLEQTMGIMKIS